MRATTEERRRPVVEGGVDVLMTGLDSSNRTSGISQVPRVGPRVRHPNRRAWASRCFEAVTR
jgi:hypothetical protein